MSYSIVNPTVGEIELNHDEVVQGARGGVRGDNSRWRTFHRQALTVAVAP